MDFGVKGCRTWIMPSLKKGSIIRMLRDGQRIGHEQRLKEIGILFQKT